MPAAAEASQSRARRDGPSSSTPTSPHRAVPSRSPSAPPALRNPRPSLPREKTASPIPTRTREPPTTPVKRLPLPAHQSPNATSPRSKGPSQQAEAQAKVWAWNKEPVWIRGGGELVRSPSPPPTPTPAPPASSPTPEQSKYRQRSPPPIVLDKVPPRPPSRTVGSGNPVRLATSPISPAKLSSTPAPISGSPPKSTREGPRSQSSLASNPAVSPRKKDFHPRETAVDQVVSDPASQSAKSTSAKPREPHLRTLSTSHLVPSHKPPTPPSPSKPVAPPAAKPAPPSDMIRSNTMPIIPAPTSANPTKPGGIENTSKSRLTRDNLHLRRGSTDTYIRTRATPSPSPLPRETKPSRMNSATLEPSSRTRTPLLPSAPVTEQKEAKPPIRASLSRFARRQSYPAAKRQDSTAESYHCVQCGTSLGHTGEWHEHEMKRVSGILPPPAAPKGAFRRLLGVLKT
ncbi:hypothetical protein BOTBODRAFT_173309 [Botryobasidium botryosum FD-172 SS1]|uniref:Uncharacterized protein n=1 Tax=Botryobasidium botryosum (strain FD-172 SS1) TaxID=930990 RepID=A0A067MKE4_BOTB1|nr:hypothetical protein BOTBODRAFT_173309 [Botryobasidium botryosum FD-172 SS1]